MITYFLLFIVTSFYSCQAYEILDGIPITFRIDGDISYTPSSGGIPILGYKLVVGYDRRSWIGVKFMQLTSQSTYDIVIVQRDQSPIGGVYQSSVGEYFVSSGRPDKLLSDSVNNMDKQSPTYSESNYFQVQISRTKGNTNGEDWQGGNFVKICFVTSSQRFNQDQWQNLTQICYGYDVTDDYFSTFRGKEILGSTEVDNKNSLLYGGIQGPFLEARLFWYVQSAPLSDSEVIIKFDNQISETVGKDYFSCTDGDKYGDDTISLDTQFSGYNDGECTVQVQSSYVKISYKRYIYTYDEFDTDIYQNLTICVLVGTTQKCENIALETLYPIMTVESSIVIYESYFGFTMLVMLYILLLVI